MGVIRVTRDDLMGCAADGVTPVQAAMALGVSHAAVRRAEDRYGIALPRREAAADPDTVRARVRDMLPGDAVAYLLDVVEAIVGPDDGVTGYFPDRTLTRSERRIFLILYASEGRVVRRDDLYGRLYVGRADGEMPEPKTVDVLVCHLRRKLGTLPLRIVTAWGEGYRLERDAGYRCPWEGRE